MSQDRIGRGKSITRNICLRLLILALPLLGTGCATTGGELRAEKHLAVLQNSRIVVGVLPQVGGLVVVLRQPKGGNVLKAVPELWDEPPEKRIVPSPFYEWKAYYGETVWLGPQSEWWTHQDLNKERRDSKAGFPPDPYLAIAPYRVAERRGDYIKMIGPDSPISGVRLEKEIRINQDGTVRFKAKAVNVTDKPLAWDLWFNMRLDGFGRAYAPVDDKGLLRLAGAEKDFASPMPHEIADGFFTFVPKEPPREKQCLVRKAFIHPRRGLIVGFAGNQAVAIRFDATSREAMHPEQTNVEIYNNVPHKRADALLELEHHAALRTLQPGESMEAEETWTVMDYSGANTSVDHVRFIEKQFPAASRGK